MIDGIFLSEISHVEEIRRNHYKRLYSTINKRTSMKFWLTPEFTKITQVKKRNHVSKSSYRIIGRTLKGKVKYFLSEAE